MAEDERTVEAAADTDESDSTPAEGGSTPAESGSTPAERDSTSAESGSTPAESGSADDAAESFFELGDDLDRASRAREPDRTGVRRGLVVGAERVDRARVPDEYPLDADTDRVVALTVDFGVEETTAYLAWPADADGEAALTRLLDAAGVEFSELYGREVLVERLDGHDVLVTPAESPRGRDRSAGVLAGLAAVAGVLGLGAATGGVGLPLALLWAGVTFGWLPYVTFSDAWYLRTHSDWAGGPLFWTVLSALPVLNLLAGAVYLRQRSRASFFGSERSVLGSAAAKVRSRL